VTAERARDSWGAQVAKRYDNASFDSRNRSGLDVRPVYDVADLTEALPPDGAEPGQYPYTRGIYPIHTSISRGLRGDPAEREHHQLHLGLLRSLLGWRLSPGPPAAEVTRGEPHRPVHREPAGRPGHDRARIRVDHQYRVRARPRRLGAYSPGRLHRYQGRGRQPHPGTRRSMGPQRHPGERPSRRAGSVPR
jgi:hypothetical protein